MKLISDPEIHSGEKIYALTTLDPEFIELWNSRDEPDHILLFQTKGEQEAYRYPGIFGYDANDIVYVRKGTEIEEVWDDVENERLGYNLTYEGETHLVVTETNPDVELKFQEIKKKFFKEENIEKFKKKFVDDDGNAQSGSGERGLTILNIKKKDMWELVQDNTECLGKQIVFKGTPRDDVLVGNSCNNVLLGGKGDDILDGGAGDDFLVGGQGRDTFVYSEGKDVIVNFDEEEDRLDLGDLQYGIDYIIEEFVNPIGGTGVNFFFAES